MKQNSETGSVRQPYSEPQMKVVLMQSKSIIAASPGPYSQTEEVIDIIG